MDLFKRNAITVAGNPAGRVIVLAHGYGCDQAMWKYLSPHLAADYRLVTFDHVGAGKSSLHSYNRDKYGSLDGYAHDVLEIVRFLDLTDIIFIGHSVSATIGVLASNIDPSCFSDLVLIAPSPCYLNDGAYRGGLDRDGIAGLIEMMENNFTAWSSSFAELVIANDNQSSLTAELHESMCRLDSSIASHFASVIFSSDHREDFRRVSTPTLILQCAGDTIAPEAVGMFVHQQIKHSVIATLEIPGHSPHVTAPEETARHILTYLQRHDAH